MGKVIKVVGWGLGVLLLLVLAAAVILPQVVDPNDYKDEIIAKVKEQTGRDLIIDGRIALSVFPGLVLRQVPSPWVMRKVLTGKRLQRSKVPLYGSN